MADWDEQRQDEVEFYRSKRTAPSSLSFEFCSAYSSSSSLESNLDSHLIGFAPKVNSIWIFNIFNLMNSIGLEPNGLTFTALIDGLSKQGRLEQANEILGSIWNLNQIWLNRVVAWWRFVGGVVVGARKDQIGY